MNTTANTSNKHDMAHLTTFSDTIVPTLKCVNNTGNSINRHDENKNSQSPLSLSAHDHNNHHDNHDDNKLTIINTDLL